VSAGAWVDAGLALLRAEGQHALTIERLCRALRLTKGAFYHHFRDVSVFHAALLEAWEQRLTGAIIDAVRAAPTRSRGRVLSRAVAGLDVSLELAVRAWALRSAVARARVARIDRRRIATLEKLWRARGHKRPRALADVEYCAFLGSLQAFGGPGTRRGRQAERTLERALAARAPSRR
jgi:AcrR family transcriptional regulator